MIKSKYFAVALGTAMLLGAALPASASALSSTQITAIINLLQSFGADQSTINNVNVALGGSSSGPSCSTFADLKYGDFDAYPGGHVSQLQDWLGISSNTFGYGTYGPKTKALWVQRCGTIIIQPFATIDQSSLTASTNGKDAAAVTITGTASNVNQIIVNIKGQTPANATVVNGRWSATIPNVYPNTYTVQIDDNDSGNNFGQVLTQGTLTVTGGSNQLTATIDANSLNYSAGSGAVAQVTLTGSASNTGTVILTVPDAKVYMNVSIPVTNGRWSANLGAMSVGTHSVSVYDTNNNLLVTGGLVVTSGNAQPSATIDQNGQTVSSGNFPVSGTFSNTDASSAIVVLISQPYSGATDWNTVGGYLRGTAYAATPSGNRLYSYSTAVTGANHQFSVSFSSIPSGIYTVLVYTGTYNNQTLLAEGTLTVPGAPVAAIDQSSLTASTGGKDATAVTITGTASGVSMVEVAIKGQQSAYPTVINGRWSATISNVYPNTYTVQVSDTAKGYVLTTGTLTVTQ